uniref:Nucleoside phosphorylase domain-containing protein n=1 Tax=Amphimedon queenslandica TaxID=400682 RepID=A0A1X7UCL0_AMPQE
MPATTSEEDPVVYYLKQSPEDLIETDIDGLRVYIGHYGKIKVIVVVTAPDKSRQGPIHAGIIASKMLEKIPSIKYVVAVGVCFGMGTKNQKLGDVIISGTICDFTNKREGVDEDDEYQRGPHHLVNRTTVDKFRPPHGFKMPHNIKVSIGVLISTGSLIDHPDVKQELLEFRRDAIAGEMEGAGIMAAIDYVPDRVEAIVIKGIGDWGDGDKEATKKWKPFAARAAAHYVHAALNDWKQLQ